MNAELLHAVARDVLAEIAATRQVDQLSQLQQHTTQLASAPQDQGAQITVSDMRESLRIALARAASNSASPGQIQLLEELELWQILGDELQARIDEAFVDKELTVASAAAAVKDILDEVESKAATLEHLVESFEALGIGHEELGAGEYELGVLIPRHAVDDALRPLGEELIAFKKIFVPFFEVAGDGRPTIRVRSISSSDFMIFLAATPAAALLIAQTLKTLIEAYRSFLDIRLKIAELKKLEVPDDALGTVVDVANERIALVISQKVEDLVDTEVLTSNRKNELRTELNVSLWQLAVKIDEGYNIDVRAGLPESSNGDDDVEDPDEATQIRTMRTELQYLKIEGEPILRLPKGIDEELHSSEDEDEEPNGTS